MASLMVLDADRARAFCLDVLGQLGVPAAAAAVGVDSMLYASLRGVDSHGITLLSIYAESIRSGQTVPDRCWKVRRQGPASAWCDGQNGFGPALALKAVDLAMDKARASGLGAVSLADGNYVGALGFYVARAAAAGFLGLAAANATPRIVPYGGRDGLHGTNPIAYAVPADEAEPLVFDAATGHSAARVIQALEEGRPLADGVALDSDGRATNDPQAALEGRLMPVGGAFSFGLGLLVDILSGGLSGGPCGTDVPPATNLEVPYGCSFFILAINPAHFGGSERLAECCDFLMQSARASRPAEGFDRVRVPGQRAAEEKRRRLAAGIPFTKERWQKLLDRLEACDLEVEDWRFVV
jgi:ureidoglycolate dehydrogenase (NAD+)